MAAKPFTVEQAKANPAIVAALPHAGRNNSRAITDGANCRNAGAIMFPSHGGSGAALAKALCDKCGVADMCLARAFDMGDQIAVFGGMTGEERSRWRGAWNKLKPKKKPKS